MTKPHTMSSLSTWADGHETLCDERHDAIKLRLSRIETILLAVFGTIVLGGASVLWQVLSLGSKLGH